VTCGGEEVPPRLGSLSLNATISTVLYEGKQVTKQKVTVRSAMPDVPAWCHPNHANGLPRGIRLKPYLKPRRLAVPLSPAAR
jgi:hypothetical protein